MGCFHGAYRCIPTGIYHRALRVWLLLGRRWIIISTASGGRYRAGINQTGQNDVPSGLTGVVQVADGHYHTCALKSSGTVQCWGAPFCASGGAIGAMSAGMHAGMASAAGPPAYSTCCPSASAGDASYGQCTPPSGLSGVVQVVTGMRHTCALKSDGTVACWGAFRLGRVDALLVCRRARVGAARPGKSDNTCAAANVQVKKE